ncbi:MAG: M48 family metallopeptidase [Paludibacteraceae bacterium]|nr:M48 family metallopeptidase [Paludibacteraceae bacterium]
MDWPQNYIIIRRELKHVRVRVSEDETIRVFAPQKMSDEQLMGILKKRQSWIDKQMTFFKNREGINLQFNEVLLYGNRYTYFYDTNYANKVVINDEYHTIRAQRNLTNLSEQEKWLKSVAKKHFATRVKDLSLTLNLPYNKLYVRGEKSKWGNCSAEKNISLNWRLIKAPKFVIDYVIVHELLHTIVMKHTVQFRTLLRSHYPDYEKAQNWLKKFGNSL